MSAVVGQDWRPKTLRELFIQWQAVMLDRWHHTAHIKGMLSQKDMSYSDLHPFIKKMKRSTGAVIKPKSIFSRNRSDVEVSSGGHSEPENES